jgi:predicted protein tyrosine phosphatase
VQPSSAEPAGHPDRPSAPPAPAELAGHPDRPASAELADHPDRPASAELADHPDRLRWNARYGGRYQASFVPHPLAVRALSLPDGPVTDLACGPSGSALAAAAAGRLVTAVDVSEVALGLLGGAAERRGLAGLITLVHADLGRWRPESASSALVLGTGFWDPLVFAAAAAAVAPGGVIAWEAFTTAALSARPNLPAAWCLGPGEPASLLPPGFEVIGQDEVPDCGRGPKRRLLARRVAVPLTARRRRGAAMQPPLFTIERDGPGRLSTMARPRGGSWLASEVDAMAMHGVNVLVSLLSDAEVAKLALEEEQRVAEAAGMTFFRLPTPDRQVPEPAAALALAETLKSRLGQGDSIVVHCYEGIGRSSTVAAVVLVLEGLDPAAAVDRISAARGLQVPDTAAQREFIDSVGR